MSNVPYLHTPINKDWMERRSKQVQVTVMSSSFSDLRSYVLGYALPMVSESQDPHHFRKNNMHSLYPENVMAKLDPAFVFDKMFLEPLEYWQLPEEDVAQAGVKYLEKIKEILEDKNQTPYESVGKLLNLFKDFKEDMPYRFYKKEPKNSSLPSKVGKPYGIRHSVLRSNMDFILEKISLDRLPKQDIALFPDGNPWSKTMSKVVENLEQHSKFKDLKRNMDFVFKIGRDKEEFKCKEQKHAVLKELSHEEKLVMSPSMGNLLEPKTNPWLWQGKMPSSLPGGPILTGKSVAGNALLSNGKKDDDPFGYSQNKQTSWEDKTLVAKLKDAPRKFFITAKEILSDLTREPVKPKPVAETVLPAKFLLQFHILTSNSKTVAREFIYAVLEGKTKEGIQTELATEMSLSKKQKSERILSAWDEIENQAKKELSVLAKMHVQQNPWSIMDMGESPDRSLVIDALRLQPGLLFKKDFLVKFPDWQELLEEAKPGYCAKLKEKMVQMEQMLDAPAEENIALFRELMGEFLGFEKSMDEIGYVDPLISSEMDLVF